MAEYSPTSVYDLPDLLAGQAMGGVLSGKSVKGATLSPDTLTPEERIPLSERLGVVDPSRNRMVNALASVATNPFVWLMFLTGPVGRAALTSGKPFSWVQAKYSVFAKKSLGFLDNFVSDLTFTRGSNAESVALAIGVERQRLSKQAFVDGLGPAESKMLGRLNKMAGEDLAWHPETPLNPEVYAKGTKQRQLTQNLHDLFFAEQHNLDGDYVATVPAGKTRFGIKMDDEVREVLADLPEGLDQEDVRQQAFRSANREAARVRRQVLDNWNAMTKKERRLVGGDRDAYLEAYAPKVVALDGKNVVELQSSPNLLKQRAPLLPQGSISKALDQFGPEYQEWSGAVKKEWKRSFVNYVGDSDHFEKTGGLQFDDRKLDRLVSSLQSSWSAQGSMGAVDAGAASVQGKELLLSLIDEFEFNKAAGMSFDDAKKHLMGKFKEAVNVRQWNEERWAPLNSFVKGKLSTGKVPPERLEMDTQKIMETAPWSASKAYVDKIAPLTQKETMFDPEYLERLGERLGGLSDEGYAMVQRGRKAADKAWFNPSDQHQRAVMFAAPKGDWYKKHIDDLHVAAVMETMPLPKATVTDALQMGSFDESVKDNFTMVRGQRVRLRDPLPVNDASASELLSRVYTGLQSPAVQQRFRGVAASALNMAGPEFVAVRNAQIRNKEMAGWFANSLAGKLIEKSGKEGQDFIGRMREFGDLESSAIPKDFSQGLASFFYTTHLGMNLGSVVMNLTQPLILAGSFGTPKEVAGAYVDAFKDMAAYAKNRAALGLKWLSPTEKLRVMEESFPFMGKATGGRNLLGIGPDSYALVDSQLRKPGGKWGRVSDGMLSGFEVSEWFNRNVTAHLMKRMSMSVTGAKDIQGLIRARPSFLQDVEGFVLRMQYGQADINTPDLFKRGALRNPLVRQFLSFPLRTATAAFYEVPTMGGEDYWRGLYKSVVKGMGMSALVYEAGKHLLGADLSKGLYASAAVDILGGDRVLGKGQEVIPLPPVASIPIDMLRGVASGDVNLLSGAVARLVPGGVALNRAWGVLPNTPEWAAGLPGGVQKTYADWGFPTPDGNVPVYKQDGTLIDYKPPSSLIARGLGVDLGAWQEQGSLDNYLVKQRDQIAAYKRRYMEALYTNESGLAQSIANEFQSRYKGVPLTVSQANWKQFLGSKEQSRTERVYDRLQPEVRNQFTPLVAGAGGNLAQPLAAGPAAQRQRSNELTTEEVVRKLMERTNAVGPGGRPQPFEGFSPSF